MSAILGVFKTNDACVKEPELKEMKDPINHWGPECSSNWIHENMGLGQLLSYNTPEAKFEKLPLTDKSGNFILVSRARIDNRDELSKTFGFATNELASTPDSCFIMEAFKKWGEECVHHLLGDWAFAIWNKKNKELFVARDHHGNTGLYYYYSGNMFVFSSSIKSLLALKEIPNEINELFVTKVLTSWPHDGEETAYKNIYRLPPAHHLSISKEKFEIKRYWYLEKTPLLNLNTAEDYYEQFLELYQNAVKVRLRSEKPIAATLSGGLDSGSVSALAADELLKRGQRLKCYGSVPKYDLNSTRIKKSRFGDESAFIKATAEYSGNIDVRLLNSHDISVLEGVYKSIDMQKEPGHTAGGFYWVIDILQNAKKDGFGTLLTGQGGNATISWTGQRNTDSFRGIYEHYRKGEISTKKAIKHLVKTSFPNISNSSLSTKKLNSYWNNYSAINLEYAKEIGLNVLIRQGGNNPFNRSWTNPIDKRMNIIRPGRNHVGSLWQNFGLNYGIEVRDPTFDKTLMEFCISVPDSYYLSKDYDRDLIRNALNGYLPDKVRLNKKRGLQAADIQFRIRENEKEIKKILNGFEGISSVNRLLDLDKMKSVFANVSTDNADAQKIGSILLRGLGIGMFIEQFETNDF